MKQLFSIYLLIALLFSAVLFLLLFQLRLQPTCIGIETLRKAIKGRDDGQPVYTDNYISTVRQAYTKTLQQGDTLSLSNDSLFILSWKQMVDNFSVNANPYPVIKQVSEDELNCDFEMIAKKNFTIQIQLKKVNGIYMFHKIRNLDSLLVQSPPIAEH